jgi:hypothetical protein
MPGHSDGAKHPVPRLDARHGPRHAKREQAQGTREINMTAKRPDPFYILWMLFLVFLLIAGALFLYAGIVENQERVYQESLEKAKALAGAWHL